MSKRFIRAYIEISDFCGLSCPFCSAPKGRRGEMGLELFKKVCSEIAPLSQSITFHLLGDPLYLPNFPIYLQIAKDHHLNVEIVTSGLYLSKFDKSLLLSPPIRQISISLSALETLKDEVKEKIIQETLELIATHQKLSSQTYINLRMHADKLNNTLAQRLAEHFCVKNDLAEKARVRLAYKVFLVLTKSFEWVRAEEETQSGEVRKKCYGLLSQVGILSNGVVVPCCIDCDGGIDLGNIKDQSLEEILNSPRAIKIIEGFKSGIAIENQCKRCTYPATS